MDSCCENKAGELAQLRASQSRVLYIALAINAVMFVVEFSAGWIASSTALLGDSLDMFGDASVYALTLFVLDRSRRARAGAALFKGGKNNSAFSLRGSNSVQKDGSRRHLPGKVEPR